MVEKSHRLCELLFSCNSVDELKDLVKVFRHALPVALRMVGDMEVLRR